MNVSWKRPRTRPSTAIRSCNVFFWVQLQNLKMYIEITIKNGFLVFCWELVNLPIGCDVLWCSTFWSLHRVHEDIHSSSPFNLLLIIYQTIISSCQPLQQLAVQTKVKATVVMWVKVFHFQVETKQLPSKGYFPSFNHRFTCCQLFSFLTVAKLFVLRAIWGNLTDTAMDISISEINC